MRRRCAAGGRGGAARLSSLALRTTWLRVAGEEREQFAVFLFGMAGFVSEEGCGFPALEIQRFQHRRGGEESGMRDGLCFPEAGMWGQALPARRVRQSICRLSPSVVAVGLSATNHPKKPRRDLAPGCEHDWLVLDGGHRVFVLQAFAGQAGCQSRRGRPASRAASPWNWSASVANDTPRAERADHRPRAAAAHRLVLARSDGDAVERVFERRVIHILAHIDIR